MANPLETIVTLAKKGDKRVLIGGAVVVGGGVGLAVFLKNKNAGGVNALPDPTPPSLDPGGGGGGGGGDNMPELPGLELPPLPEVPAIETPPLPEPSPSPNLIPVEPYYQPLPEPISYNGGDYGNPVGYDPVMPDQSKIVANFNSVSKPIMPDTHQAPHEAPKPIVPVVHETQHEAPAPIIVEAPKRPTGLSPDEAKFREAENFAAMVRQATIDQNAKNAQNAVTYNAQRQSSYYQSSSYFGANSPFASGFSGGAEQVSRQPQYYQASSYFGAASPYASGFKQNRVHEQRSREHHVTNRRVEF